MKTQNVRIAAKASQKEDKSLWPVAIVTLVVIISMAHYNNTVLFMKTDIQTLSK
jgi:hypothetical protein